MDWTASAIHVRSNYMLGQFGTPKSKLSSRSVPMADEVGGALERYQARGNVIDAVRQIASGPHYVIVLEASAVGPRAATYPRVGPTTPATTIATMAVATGS